jgi:hypothetical protein
LPFAAVALGVGIAWASYGSGGVLDDLGRTGSIDGRLRMWRVSAMMIADRPGLGWGVGRFAAVYPGYQRAFLISRDAGPVTDLTDHPHNEYLYWAVEAGAAGLAIALIVVLLVVRAGIRTHARQQVVPWAAGLVAVSVHAAVDVPLHLPANATLCCLLLAGFVATAAVDPSIRSRLSGVQRATLIIMALMIVTQGVRLIVVDRAVRGARHFLAAGDPASALRVAAEGLWLEPASGELLTTLARAQAVTDQPAAALVTARRAARGEAQDATGALDVDADRGSLSREAAQRSSDQITAQGA